jgi:hypothetical protein
MRTRSLILGILGALVTACGGDAGTKSTAPTSPTTPTTPTTPTLVAKVSPDVASVIRGVDITVSAQVTDGAGNPLNGHAVTFSSSDASIATVTQAGLVHPIANGTVNIIATVDGTLQAIAKLTVLDPRLVTGTVATSDAQPLPELEFTARVTEGNTTRVYRVNVNRTTGTFSLLIPGFPSSGPAVEFFIDAPAGVTRSYFPSWQRIPGGLSGAGFRMLLIPRTITPDSGSYKGQQFAVDMNEAFTAVCGDLTNANCQSYWPSYFLSGIKNWADASRPIPLALDRTTGAIAATDSIALWNIISAMEADMGRKLFKPVNFTSFTTTGYTSGEVLVSYDPSLTGFGGYTNWSWDAQGVIYQARTRVSQVNYLSQPGLMTHELNHALGFHHTCRWTTVMGGYGCSQAAKLTGNDVAYYHLAEQVRRQVELFKPTWSVSSALQGERVLELGVPVTNALPITLSPLFTLSLPSRSDGAP